MAPVFEKKLTDSEISGKRLFYPTSKLGALPAFRVGTLDVEFPVSYGIEIPPYNFRCIKRDGRYAQPTICKGWSQMVRDKGLSAGDILVFHKDANGMVPVPYWIEVYRNINGVRTRIG